MASLFDTLPDGIAVFRNYLPREKQIEFVEMCRRIARKSPLVYPRMRSGTPFNVRLTSVGEVGWYADEKQGFGYVARHPETGEKWTPMPLIFREFAVNAAAEVGWQFSPDTCLINYYDIGTGKLGLHQDENERDKTQPIVTLSLGDSCIFQVGGFERSVKPQEVRLDSGDCLVMFGQGRMLFHGVKEILPVSSNILSKPGRVSLTFRKAL